VTQLGFRVSPRLLGIFVSCCVKLVRTERPHDFSSVLQDPVPELILSQNAGSVPDGVIEIFHWHNPSARTMALGSTQPLRYMSTRSISWESGGLTTLPPLCAECLETKLPGTLRASNKSVLGLFDLSHLIMNQKYLVHVGPKRNGHGVRKIWSAADVRRRGHADVNYTPIVR
jgi:hypothetical protein